MPTHTLFSFSKLAYLVIPISHVSVSVYKLGFFQKDSDPNLSHSNSTFDIQMQNPLRSSWSTLFEVFKNKKLRNLNTFCLSIKWSQNGGLKVVSCLV